MPIPRAMISGSSSAAILGLSEWTTPFLAWQRIMESRQPGFSVKRGYAPLEVVDNAAVRWGNAFEDSVIMLTEAATGESISNREKEFFMSDDGFEASCHIDGMFTGGDMYEGKTTMEMAYRRKWGTPGTNRIPQSYAVQVQHNLMLTGAERCTVGVLVFPKAPQDWEDMGWSISEIAEETVILREKPYNCPRPITWAMTLADMGYFHIYTVMSDPNTQEAMKDAYREFWQNNIIGEAEPDPSDWEDIRRMFTAPVGTIVADKQLTGWLNEYKDIRKEIGASGPLKKRQDQLKTLAMAKARKMNPVIDDDSQEKMIIMSADGHKLASFDGTTFR